MECLGQKIKRFCKIAASNLPIIRMLTISKIFYHTHYTLKNNGINVTRKITPTLLLLGCLFKILCYQTRAICEAQLYVLTDIKTLSLMKHFLLKSLIFSQKTSATKLKRNYVFANNLFSKHFLLTSRLLIFIG